MADNKSQTRPQDASRVSMNEDYEVRYWTEKFKCSREELEEAVKAVGSSAQKVEAYFSGK
jgi:hypothetical protein